MEERKRPYYFNLVNDGDTAIVRLLHSSVETMERVTTHTITVNEKKKKIKCLGEVCPLCIDKGDKNSERLFVHLFDYTDNTEKVWDRTTTIIPEFEKISKDWQPLSSAVIRITRKGNSFPKYECVPLNPMQYIDPKIDNSLIDCKLAKFYHLNRKKEDIEKYLSTGSFPEQTFIPRDEYIKQLKEKENGANNNPYNNQITIDTKVESVKTENVLANGFDNDDFDPFV